MSTKRGFDPTSFILGKSAAGGGGGDISTQSLIVTANGTYRAPSGKAYTPVVVNVPAPETYAGSYEAESDPFSDATLPTAGKLMAQDVTVKKIPVAEVSNTSGGYTITIGR